jgi:acetylornithine deacetylase/succinyl-diaminopimelate desuccinylase-like protein
MRGVFSALLILALPGLCLTSCNEAGAIAENPVHVEAQRCLTDYLRIDTTNPPGNETAGAEFLNSVLAAEGIEGRLVGSNPARQSVWARLESGSSEPALLLLHHIDVVPADAESWKVPPFSGRTSNGYIWGRGALDAKSLGVAHLMAFLELHRMGRPLRRDVVFLAVIDEETGGEHGIRELLESNPEIFENVGFVLNEGGSNQTVVDRVTFWGIEVDQKVPLWVRLTTRGAGGHGAAPPADGGASRRLVEALHAVQQLPLETALVPTVERYFHAIALTRPGERGRTLGRIAEVMSSPKELEQLPESYRILLGDTLAITRLRAGDSTNSVPAYASGDLDIRLLPGSDPEAKLRELRAYLPGDVEIEVLLSGPPSPPAPVDTELFEILQEEMLLAEPESRVGPMAFAGTTDSRFFRNRGVVAYGVSPFKVNYYDAAGVHGENERIRVAFFTQGVDLVRAVVGRFCQADPA